MRRTILVIWMLAAAAWAQVPSATITGVVRDPSGLPVPKAQVTARLLDASVERSQATASDGSFRLSALPPGSYRVRVEHPSFAPYEIARVELGVRQALDLTIALKLGGRAESVTVAEIRAPVEAAAGPSGFTVNAAQVSLLPLAVRNFGTLMTLGPGVIPRHLGGFTHDVVNDVQPSRGAVALNHPVNGVRSTGNTFLLDGVLNTDGNANAIVVNPPLESVQEFRLQTSASPAEFGFSGGAVVNMVTRSGSERFHGGLFEYFRNDKLDARQYFDPGDGPKAPLRQNQFGGQAGGPFPGASRLFYFAGYESLRLSQGRASASIVPDEALRGGDFGGQGAIRDPRTGQPFAGNRIARERIDPIARAFLDNFQPLPNRPGEPSNFVETTPDAAEHDRVTARVDAQYSPRASLFARYSLNAERGRQGHPFPVLPTLERIRAQHAVVGHTWVMAADRVNELRVGYNRLRVFELPRHAFTRDVVGELGINGIDRDPFNFGLPTFLVSTFSLTTDDPTLPLTQRDQLFQVLDHYSARHGRHTLGFGGDARWFHMNYLQRASGRGRYTFSGTYTGDPFADFLLGLPQITERTVGEPQAYFRRFAYSLYAQDEVRWSPRLVVTLGLRYNYTAPFTEQRDNMFNLDYTALFGAPAPAGARPAAPVLVRAGDAGLGRALVRADRNDFAPRAGIAWRPLTGRNVIFRAGYGVFYNAEIAAETYDLVRNGIRNEQNRAPDDRPILTLRDGFPAGSGLVGFPTLFGLDVRARTPYVQQWNAAVQAGAGGFLFEAAYVGTKGTKLGRFRQFNTPQHVETGENLPPRAGDIQELRTFSRLGKIIQRQHISNSIYHSLQLRAERRLARALQFQGSFTWAKAIDDADGVIPGFFDSMGAQDERNLRLERGLAFFDVRKRLTFNFIYDLPLGRGRRFVRDAGFWTALVSRWRLSGIALLQDGTPLNPVFFALAPANSDTPNRPNVVPGQKITLPRSQRTPERFFNTDAFSTPEALTFGNAGRNIIPGPGNVLFDLAMHRAFALGESRSLEFRGELFNAFNHPNFGIPGPYPDFGPFFGRIFSVGEPRRIQLALKLNF